MQMDDVQAFKSQVFLKGINVVPQKGGAGGQSVRVEMFWSRALLPGEQVSIDLQVMVTGDTGSTVVPLPPSQRRQAISLSNRDAVFNLGNSGTIVSVIATATKGEEKLGSQSDWAFL
jgi:hypothetical protein